MKPKTGDKPWTCVVCGERYATRAAVERFLSGSKAGDVETPHLCPFCARLRHSVMQEARAMAAEEQA